MIARSPILSIQDVHKSFDDTAALSGVSLDLYSGELLGFLGPNGAGKTTLIRCLAGRTRMDAGQILLDGKRRHRGILGIVPQSIALYEDLTAEQNLRAFGRLQGLRGKTLRGRIDDALNWSALDDRRSHFVGTFSGGMKRRLNIACSVLHAPKILLLDEPTVGVDPQSRERIYTMLHELREQGAAILLTTHHLEEAQFRCDRIAIVDRGRVIQVGTLDELISNTVGHHQHLRIRFVRPPRNESIQPLVWDASRQQASCLIHDAATELPAILQRLRSAGAALDNVSLQTSTLQDVFLHLTGKELRE